MRGRSSYTGELVTAVQPEKVPGRQRRAIQVHAVQLTQAAGLSRIYLTLYVKRKRLVDIFS